MIREQISRSFMRLWTTVCLISGLNSGTQIFMHFVLLNFLQWFWSILFLDQAVLPLLALLSDFIFNKSKAW